MTIFWINSVALFLNVFLFMWSLNYSGLINLLRRYFLMNLLRDYHFLILIKGVFLIYLIVRIL